MKNKKANLEIIVPSILILTLGAIILVFGLIMLDNLEDNAYKTTTVSFSNTSTVGTAGNASGTYVNGYNPTTYRNCALTITYAYNTTTSTYLISSGNYTIVGCLINGSTSTVEVNNASWNVTGAITYSADTEASNSANDTIVGLGKFADYWDLIVLAIVISVIISLLLVVFSMRKQQ